MHNTLTMKHLLLAAAASFGLCTISHAEYRVLAVGIDQYKEPGKNLTGCVNDMETVVAALQKHYSIPAAAVTKITNQDATKMAVVKAFEDKLITPSKEGDTVIFYYAGHGDVTPDMDGDEDDNMDEALILTDGSPQKPETWLTDDEMGRLLAKIKTQNVVLIFDSCHSGTIHRTASGLAESRSSGFGNHRIQTSTSGQTVPPDRFGSSIAKTFPNQLVLTACDANEEANEIRGGDWDKLGKPGHKDGGLFTTALLEVLERDPNTTMSQLLSGVQKQTMEFTSKLGKKAQQPQFEMPKADITLAAYVKGQVPPVPAAPAAPVPPAPQVTLTSDSVILSGSIRLDLKTNGRNFTDGELLTVQVSADQDCFIRLYYLSSDNKVAQIYPNQYQKENRVKKGTTVTIPGPTAEFALKMGKPYGNEVLKVVASTEQFTDLENDKWAQQLFQSYSQSDLQSMSTRGVNTEGTKRKFGEAVLIYSVREKSPGNAPVAPANATPLAPSATPATPTAAPATGQPAGK